MKASLLSLLAFALPGVAPIAARTQEPAPDPESVRLTAAKSQAQEDASRAEERIVQAYSDFEQLHAAARKNPLAPRWIPPVAEVVTQARAEIAAGNLPGEPSGRSRLVADLRKRLAGALSGSVHETLRDAVSARLADALAPSTAGSDDAHDVSTKACDAVVGAILDPALEAHELWNRGLFREVQAAKDFAAARAALASATDRLVRYEHPERFHPAYERTPEGMVFVLGGSLTLGPNTGYDLDTEKRKTSFSITIRPFYLDATEVTNRQYAEFLKSVPKPEGAARTPPRWERAAGQNVGPGIPPPGTENLPVTGVTYEDAAAFAAWARKRLPTEDEWEAAARGPKGWRFPWGDQYQAGNANDRNADFGDAAPVGSYPLDRASCGALDMAGNVMEWVATVEGGRQASARLETNMLVVFRGGAYDRDWKECSGTFRWLWPGKTTRVQNLGFRCAKDAF